MQTFLQLRERTIRVLEFYELSGFDWMDAITKESEARAPIIDEVLISDKRTIVSGLINPRHEHGPVVLFSQIRRVAGQEIAEECVKKVFGNGSTENELEQRDGSTENDQHVHSGQDRYT